LSGNAKTEMVASVSSGHTIRVDADKYEAVRRAILHALPARAPGLTAAEMKTRILPELPEALFPGGAKVGWWMKGVQLDLEARRIIARDASKPLRFHRISDGGSTSQCECPARLPSLTPLRDQG
jgi:hypothetical protein